MGGFSIPVSIAAEWDGCYEKRQAQQSSLILGMMRHLLQSCREGLPLGEARETSLSKTGGHREAWVWWGDAGVPCLVPCMSGRLGHQLRAGVEDREG